MAKCKYEYKSSQFESILPEIPLDCKEQSTENGELCIFHDKSHYTEHEQEAAKRFEETVRESINQNKPFGMLWLLSAGYRFCKFIRREKFFATSLFQRSYILHRSKLCSSYVLQRRRFSDLYVYLIQNLPASKQVSLLI